MEGFKKMDEKEKKRSVFPKSLNDYKAVVRSEAKRTFSFMPDAPCRNPREFTEELLKFANKEGLNIVITKESMSPHFEIDGIEYYAYRKGSRFGIIVYCEMVHPEDYIPEGMDEKKYYRYRALSIVAFPVLLFTVVILLSRGDLFTTWEGIVAFGVVVVAFLANIYYIFYSYGKNFKWLQKKIILTKQPERKPVTDTRASVSGCLSVLLMFQQRVDFISEDCCPRSNRYA